MDMDRQEFVALSDASRTESLVPVLERIEMPVTVEILLARDPPAYPTSPARMARATRPIMKMVVVEEDALSSVIHTPRAPLAGEAEVVEMEPVIPVAHPVEHAVAAEPASAPPRVQLTALERAERYQAVLADTPAGLLPKD
jgi:hypothetical protein